jgi:hypothetical protein
MTSDVEVQNPAPAMLDVEEAIQELEGQRRHGKEVEGDDRLAMIREEGQPAFPWIPAATNLPQVSSDCPFGQFKTELLKFSVDLWGAPACVLFCHPADEPSNFLGEDVLQLWRAVVGRLKRA